MSAVQSADHSDRERLDPSVARYDFAGAGDGRVRPPPEALAAVPRYLAEPDAHRYGPVEGLPALVEALGRKLTTENQLDLSRSRVVVTAGGNLAFMNAVLAMADPGDEVILQAPYLLQPRDGGCDGRVPAGGRAD